jgi:hypothetical protein
VNSNSISSDAASPNGVHGSLPAIIATLCLAAILAPIAYAQFGIQGVVVIASFALAIAVSVLVSAWGASKVAQKNPLLASLFASSGVRMVAPLVLVLIVVLTGGRLAPIETAYYVVPLYLAMLAADAAVWIRESKRSGSATPKPAPESSVPTAEAI